MATIAAIRAAEGNEFLAPEAGRAAPAVARLHAQRCFVDEFHPASLPINKDPGAWPGSRDRNHSRISRRSPPPSARRAARSRTCAGLRPCGGRRRGPGLSANSVWSVPTPTFAPGRIFVPRWRTMMLPASTCSPPKTLTPSRLEWESRPLRVLPPAFLCAMCLLDSGFQAALIEVMRTWVYCCRWFFMRR